MGTVTDTFLNNIAKAMNSETFQIPAYLGVGTTEVTAIDTDASVLEGEIGTRGVFTSGRVDNVLTISDIRSASDVIDTLNGDELETSGAYGGLTGGNLFTGVIHGGVTQTTSFDIEFEYKITFGR